MYMFTFVLKLKQGSVHFRLILNASAWMFLCVCMLSKRVHQKGKQNVHHVWMVLSWNIQVHEQKNGSGLKYVLTAWSDATWQCGCSCPKWPVFVDTLTKLCWTRVHTILRWNLTCHRFWVWSCSCLSKRQHLLVQCECGHPPDKH